MVLSPLSGIRDKGALAQLPDAERAEGDTLWAGGSAELAKGRPAPKK